MKASEDVLEIIHCLLTSEDLPEDLIGKCPETISSTRWRGMQCSPLIPDESRTLETKRLIAATIKATGNDDDTKSIRTAISTEPIQPMRQRGEQASVEDLRRHNEATASLAALKTIWPEKIFKALEDN